MSKQYNSRELVYIRVEKHAIAVRTKVIPEKKTRLFIYFILCLIILIEGKRIYTRLYKFCYPRQVHFLTLITGKNRNNIICNVWWAWSSTDSQLFPFSPTCSFICTGLTSCRGFRRKTRRS